MTTDAQLPEVRLRLAPWLYLLAKCMIMLYEYGLAWIGMTQFACHRYTRPIQVQLQILSDTGHVLPTSNSFYWRP